MPEKPGKIQMPMKGLLATDIRCLREQKLITMWQWKVHQTSGGRVNNHPVIYLEPMVFRIRVCIQIERLNVYKPSRGELRGRVSADNKNKRINPLDWKFYCGLCSLSEPYVDSLFVVRLRKLNGRIRFFGSFRSQAKSLPVVKSQSPQSLYYKR